MAANTLVALILVITLSSTAGDPLLDAFVPAQMHYEKLVFMEKELVQLSRIVLVGEGKEDLIPELREIKRLADYVDAHVNSSNASIYTSHPINVYHVTKRLVNYWSRGIDAMANSKVGQQSLFTKFYNIQDNLPSEENLTAITYSLVNLQHLYSLDFESYVAGRIKKKQAEPLTSHDCFKIGEAAFENGDYYHAEKWLQKSSIMADKENMTASNEDDVIMSRANFVSNSHLLSSTYYKLDMLEEAMMMLDIVLAHDPDNRMAKMNQKFYQERQKTATPKVLKDHRLQPPKPSTVKGRNYVRLCRKLKVERKPSIKARLKCYYRNTGMFNLVKTEDLNLKPKIVIFYDVLTKTEFDFLRDVAQDMLYNNAMDGSGEGYSTLHADVKIYGHNPNGKKINQRIRDLAELKSTREPTKVSNYAVGGRKIPFVRFDNDKRADKKSSTVLFFLNNMPTGGATVFPYVRTRIQPIENSMLYWTNTRVTGEVDPMALRAECPVLFGSKWVATKIIYETAERTYKRPHDEL